MTHATSGAVAPSRDRLLRLPEVARITGRTRTTIYRDEAAGRFPKRRRIGLRAVAWSEREVHAWMAALEPVASVSGGGASAVAAPVRTPLCALFDEAHCVAALRSAFEGQSRHVLRLVECTAEELAEDAQGRALSALVRGVRRIGPGRTGQCRGVGVLSTLDPQWAARARRQAPPTVVWRMDGAEAPGWFVDPDVRGGGFGPMAGLFDEPGAPFPVVAFDPFVGSVQIRPERIFRWMPVVVDAEGEGRP